MKYYLLLSLFLVACFSSAPDITKLNADPSFCERDSDCIYEFASCNFCDCPKAMNIYNKPKLFCDQPSQESLDCYDVCPKLKPACEDNVCVAK